MDLFFFLYIKPNSNVQLVSLAQAGSEISHDTLSSAGKHFQRRFIIGKDIYLTKKKSLNVFIYFRSREVAAPHNGRSG
jgi:hypothetical protein